VIAVRIFFLLGSLAIASFCFGIASSLAVEGSAIEVPVDDAEFARLLEYFEYDRNLPLTPRASQKWIWREAQATYKVSYASVDNQRVPAYLALPTSAEGKKLPAVVLMHGGNLFWGKNEDWVQAWIRILTSHGYAVLAPDHPLFGERRPDETSEHHYAFGPYTTRDWMSEAVIDLRRGIDYLQQRSEIDPHRIAVLGGSMGGWIGSVLAAVEPRIKTTVLTVPATEFGKYQSAPGRIFNSSNYFPRIRKPLLVVLALQDEPLRNARAREMFNLVPAEKRLVDYDDRHYLDPDKYNEDILDWLENKL
jgi:cephalosporin-C deacetylase-like acetyl esterase